MSGPTRVLETHRRLHFMGIGGAGMSGLAELLLARGYEVSGCDRSPSAVTERMAALGAPTFPDHAAEHLAPAEALVVSAAVPSDHAEIVTARRRGQPIVRRADLLGAVMAGARGIAVAGTHGKSTTTAMTGAVLQAAGWDPTVLVGGRIRGQGSNVRVGGGEWLVAEADEFDRAFLALSPDHAIVNNVEPDHLDTYGNVDALREAFHRFAARVSEGGTLALGADDPGARALGTPATGPPRRRIVTFGFSRGADVRASNVEGRRLETRFVLLLPDGRRETVQLALPGQHNVRNALGAAALAWSLGIDPAAVAVGLAAVRGVERRFEIVHEDPEILIVDDYAHHPTEIMATLASARGGWPERRIVAVFQPHLYSRTRDLAAAFGAALASADVVFVTDVYAARETPIPGVSGELVSQATRAAGGVDVTYLPNGAAEEGVAARIRPGDLVVTLGAGDIDRVARGLAARLAGEISRVEAERER